MGCHRSRRSCETWEPCATVVTFPHLAKSPAPTSFMLEFQRRRYRRWILHRPQLEPRLLEDCLRSQIVAQDLTRELLELFFTCDSPHATQQFGSKSASLPLI